MADAQTAVYYSAASVWEISIKRASGKLAVSEDLPSRLEAGTFRELPISAWHSWIAGGLPLHHRDPFDRMIVAQAHVENLPVITNDVRFAAYGVDVAW
jgi:PIN domain nuclease of toxin-antitoxin system